ncbi:MAG TPA: hypothetical protein VK745_05925 [Polyangiaceae bacterium]|nr:hypothetical protein [Polyangiaceae bacterium]
MTATLGLTLGCGSSTPNATGSGAGATSAGGVTSGASGSSAGSSSSAGTSSSSAGGATGVTSTPSGPTTASTMAKALGRPANFLIGLGNDLNANSDHDLDGAFTLGTTLDLHYAYLSAYKNADGSWGSWASWNPNGTFVNVITDSADAHGVIPMFTLYSMAEQGDGTIVGPLMTDSFEASYWSDAKLLFQRLGVFGKPAVVHLEPDFWAYAEQQSKEDPTSMKVNVTANAPDCAGLSNDLVGMGHCLVRLARMYAPKAIIGFHASQWANPDPNAIVKFFNAVGAGETDVVFSDMLDRDAGCYEAGVDCPQKGSVYWDETNQTSPNFHDYLTWSTTITAGVQHPMIWWQIPLGVPSTTPGGTSGHYRDNRVHYIFSHIDEFVAAGGLGAAFGVGAAKQTDITTDGDQFKNAVAGYFKAPVALP